MTTSPHFLRLLNHIHNLGGVLHANQLYGKQKGDLHAAETLGLVRQCYIGAWALTEAGHAARKAARHA